MINEWSIENFKSIRSKATLDFGPLTLFVGQNSAGKSTVIQSILLTAQTLQSNAIARPVVLNGKILRLGSFADIYAYDGKTGRINIGFSLVRSPLQKNARTKEVARSRVHMPDFDSGVASVSAQYSFSATAKAHGSKESQLQPQLEEGTLNWNHSDGTKYTLGYVRSGDSAEQALARLSVLPEYVRISDLTSLEYSVKGDSGNAIFRRTYRLPRQTNLAGVRLRHFLPTGICVVYDAVSAEVDAAFEYLADLYGSYRYRTVPEWLHSAFSDEAFQTVLLECFLAALESATESSKVRARDAIEVLRQEFSFENFQKAQQTLSSPARKSLAIQISERNGQIKALLRAGRLPRREIAAYPSVEQLTQAAEYVGTFFSEHLKYLGPLRDEPKAIYPLLGYNDPKDVGFRGEFTAAVLDENRGERVTYIPAEAFPFAEAAECELKTKTLGEAVTDWLRHLGIAKEVRTEDKGKLGHQLTIATSDAHTHHDLTHVGVGVSQALPIVVLSLLARPGATLIFEQPELHLNPKVQTRLADFFVSLILAGKQCIIETHSEYLISRLRFLAAMAKDASLAQHVKIYFVEKPNEQSDYREVTMSDTGSIRNWPEGFFDEGERNAEAIIRAQLDKGRQRRTAQGGSAK